MAGVARSKRDALARHTKYMQRSLHCVSDAIWFAGPQPLGPEPQRALTTSQTPIKLQTAGGTRLYFTATQAFHFERRPTLRVDWKVATDAYIYHLTAAPDRDPANDLFGWHWHPDVRPECHLHVNAAFEGGLALRGTHLPTGRVSFEEVLLFLLQELDIQPRLTGWEKTLRNNLGRHERYRTWVGARKPS